MSLHHCLCCDTTNNIKLSTDFDSTSWISKFLLLLVYKQKITFFLHRFVAFKCADGFSSTNPSQHRTNSNWKRGENAFL